MDAPNCQSEGLTPQPRRISVLIVAPWSGLPKVGDSHGPHSPLVAGFIKSQSGTKSPSASFQFLLVDRWNRVVCAGLLMVYRSQRLVLSRYFPRLTLTDVVPLPKTSYAAPT